MKIKDSMILKVYRLRNSAHLKIGLLVMRIIVIIIAGSDFVRDFEGSISSFVTTKRSMILLLDLISFKLA